MTARVAIFGGSFNPPHVAHQLVALYVIETQPVDELWFVPTYKHPFAKALVDFEHRVAMCERVAAALGTRVKVSRAEETLAHAPGFVASRTLDLMEHLIAAEGIAPRLVIGADILGETSKWYRWEDLARIAPPIVVGRGGYGEIAGEHVTMPVVSATHVREVLAANGDATALVTRSVLRYIGEHGLYR